MALGIDCKFGDTLPNKYPDLELVIETWWRRMIFEFTWGTRPTGRKVPGGEVERGETEKDGDYVIRMGSQRGAGDTLLSVSLQKADDILSRPGSPPHREITQPQSDMW
ncbi:unnamed protein product [Pleuronectes platessa]|uniref:Uncharacterized protein n=1 Tax=Pleuronectes platessa TaxID=8262 RepID=A0A9N7YAV5_PLEPL|nr:unnamed protein product [Pleuronectes platessa]